MYAVIKNLVQSEKSKQLELTGVYTFLIDPKATKTDVIQAVESLYGQKPSNVNIAKTHHKEKFGQKGKKVQKAPRLVKAYVKLAKPISNVAKISN